MILLDTHVLVWDVSEPRKLSQAARAAIRRSRAGAGVGISSISLWELAVLFSTGRLRAAGTIESAVRLIVETARVSVKEITSEIAALAVQFPNDYPRDPADRLIGATARGYGAALITADRRIQNCSLLKTIW